METVYISNLSLYCFWYFLFYISWPFPTSAFASVRPVTVHCPWTVAHAWPLSSFFSDCSLCLCTPSLTLHVLFLFYLHCLPTETLLSPPKRQVLIFPAEVPAPLSLHSTCLASAPWTHSDPQWVVIVIPEVFVTQILTWEVMDKYLLNTQELLIWNPFWYSSKNWIQKPRG